MKGAARIPLSVAVIGLRGGRGRFATRPRWAAASNSSSTNQSGVHQLAAFPNSESVPRRTGLRIIRLIGAGLVRVHRAAFA